MWYDLYTFHIKDGHENEKTQNRVISVGSSHFCFVMLLRADRVDDDPKVTGSETQTSETTADALSDGLDGLNFGGKQINIFCTNYGDSKGFQYFFAEEETGDIVIDSVYRRNRTVEERLGVKLGYTEFAFGWDEKDQMYNAVRSGIMADDNGFDIICMPTYFVSTMIVEGLFGDLSSLPHVDFSKPWWSEDFIETATISGKT